MKKTGIIIASILILSCSFMAEDKTKFSDEALAEIVITQNGQKVSLKSIFDKHKGKTIVVDIWASWCGDCIAGLPKVKELQEKTKNNKNIVYLFLSVDRNKDSWKNAITKRNIVGEHYFLPLGMKKSTFAKYIVLKWIPRYMVIGKNGDIKLYNAIKANDNKIIEAINSDK